ncbi:MAG TPA: LacI family DNA-binding transcriptional regulator [Verrucomicrobiae bacterium]|nr:LacI family DNA-binding transcriptional regulator [Verrucomicrobiae bacterium]
MTEGATRGLARPTVVDIARHAGVSKSTVSFVLQGSPVVKAETRAKVLVAIEALGYVYNRGAANLRQARSTVVGMVINDLGNPFFADMAVGIERVFQSAGFVPFIANSGENPIRQSELLRLMREQGAAGLIICPAHGTTQRQIDELTSAGVPVVLAMRNIPGTRAASVVADSRRGAARATEHLLSLGHRRIAYIGGYGDMVAFAERCGGYRDALAAAGIEADPALIVEGLPSRESGVAGIERLLAMAGPPTAALCFNDVVAFGVLDGLAARDLEAGRDFALVGFDDVREARHTHPPLTTVAVDSQALGERGAHQILRMIHGDSRPVDFVGEVHLIIRASCGAARRQMS